MKLHLKILLTICVLIVFAFLFGSTKSVGANPSFFQRFQQSAATTTATSMGPGSATTTVYADTGAGRPAFNQIALAIQLTASSTSSILNWRYEYAQDTPGVDCTATPLLCDWYGDQAIIFTNASTTANVGILKTYSWTYSSSTDACSTNVTLVSVNRGCKIVLVPSLTRYVRAVFFVPIGATRSMLWTEFITLKENS